MHGGVTRPGPARTGLRRPTVLRADLRAPAGELLVQAALVGVAWWCVKLLQAADVPSRVPAVLVSTAVVLASVLLVVAAWVGRDRRSRRVAAAVGVYAIVALVVRIAGEGTPTGLQVLGASVAVLGVVGLLALSVAGAADPRRDRDVAVAVLVFVLAGTIAVATAGILMPGAVPPGGVVAAADLLAWSGAGAAGVVLLLAGTVLRRPLLRRAGLAFATLGGANAVRIVEAAPQRSSLASALEGGAVAMMLVAAVPFLLATMRTLAHQRDASCRRLEEAEAAIAGLAERDDELRNLVAGLSGAARVLTQEDAVASLDGRRLLVAAGGELERLQRMLGGGSADRRDACVGRVIRDLALVHRTVGLDVWVDIDGDPYAAVEPGVLAQVLTNLLVNCARHAPGARVWLRARTVGSQVRIEVADDGPGLPPGATAAVPRRGAGSTGSGLGLALCAELADLHGGTFTFASGSRGCTAVLDLPLSLPDTLPADPLPADPLPADAVPTEPAAGATVAAVGA
ncbi:MAG: two-component system, OmpR family, sensor kinase [Pseudonocardiales bacterium]|jgi:two-component system OmpR family sensor kinase|nr:two-component system, OmpR family, sensor kinase [Pseudonocardiales bacterium]